jgi:DNA processing protein
MSTVFATKNMKINRSAPSKHEYLAILDTIPKPPENMFFIGSIPVARRPTVAIVGTQKLTTYDKEIAYKLAYDLSKYGIIIVCGLALGTDAIAYYGTLEADGVRVDTT